MKTERDKIIEVLKEESDYHVRTDEPQEVWLISATDSNGKFDKLADRILAIQQEEAKERYEEARKWHIKTSGRSLDAGERVLIQIASGYEPTK